MFKKVILSFSSIAILGLALVAPDAVSAKSISGCRTYSTGRTTCSFSSGGTTNYYSTNPYSGRSSSGSRSVIGGNSYGSNTYSSPKSYGSRNYNTYGLGSGNSYTNSYGYNSRSGSYSNSYGSSRKSCIGYYCP